MDPGSHVGFQHQKHKSGRGPSNEHFWQVWLISVQRFQRRRFKCEKLTDGRRTLTHDKSSPGPWPGELKMAPTCENNVQIKLTPKNFLQIYQYLDIFVLPETSACDINKAKYFI